MTPEKHQASSSEFEVDSQDRHLQSKLRQLRTVDSVRTSLTVTALVAGITILGVSADALAVYDATHVSKEFLLPLWPDEVNIQPTVALAVGSTFIIVANVMSLIVDKVQSLRSRAFVHTSVTAAAPFVGFLAALVAMAVFYVANASTTADTLQSWSCRWQSVAMFTRPHFGTLCKQSQAGLYLSVLLVPLEAVVLAAAGWQMSIERYTSAYAHARKVPSPVAG